MQTFLGRAETVVLRCMRDAGSFSGEENFSAIAFALPGTMGTAVSSAMVVGRVLLATGLHGIDLIKLVVVNIASSQAVMTNINDR
jgi:hypothetical protein